jgi:methylmalonyl-CoA mutase C-terminal domain/subunit
MMKEKSRPRDIPSRILISKIGLDGHDRGALIVSRFLKDQGYEVVYSGLHKTPADVASIALQEDVQAIGLSILSGSHLPLIKQLRAELENRNIGSVILFVGGTIPKADESLLRELGVNGIFPTASPLTKIGEWLKDELEKRKSLKS